MGEVEREPEVGAGSVTVVFRARWLAPLNGSKGDTSVCQIPSAQTAKLCKDRAARAHLVESAAFPKAGGRP
jgi:hypothetical protein